MSRGVKVLMVAFVLSLLSFFLLFFFVQTKEKHYSYKLLQYSKQADFAILNSAFYIRHRSFSTIGDIYDVDPFVGARDPKSFFVLPRSAQ